MVGYAGVDEGVRGSGSIQKGNPMNDDSLTELLQVVANYRAVCSEIFAAHDTTRRIRDELKQAQDELNRRYKIEEELRSRLLALAGSYDISLSNGAVTVASVSDSCTVEMIPSGSTGAGL